MRTVADHMGPALPAMAGKAGPLLNQHSCRFPGQSILRKRHPEKPIITVRDDLIHRGGKSRTHSKPPLITDFILYPFAFILLESSQTHSQSFPIRNGDAALVDGQTEKRIAG